MLENSLGITFFLKSSANGTNERFILESRLMVFPKKHLLKGSREPKQMGAENRTCNGK